MKKLYCLSDYFRYGILEATSEWEAVCMFNAGDNLVKLTVAELASPTARVAVMCCAYEGEIAHLFEKLGLDIDRVIVMDAHKHTSFYSLTF